MVIALSDEAALAALGRRGWHQRAAEMIGQRGMASQRRHQCLEQCRAFLAGQEVIVDPARFAQPVAQLAEIARAAASCHHAAQRAAEIGQSAQHRAQIAAQQRIAVQPID